MALQALETESELRAAYAAIRDGWSAGATELSRVVGYQGGGGTYTVWWRPDEHVWAVFDESTESGRYWCGYGTQDAAAETNLVPNVEINLSMDGINRQVGGVVAKDMWDVLWLAHTGQVAGGRKGISKTAFRAWLKDQKTDRVRWSDGVETDAFAIARIGSSLLPRQIAAFVRSVCEFKQSAVGL